MIPFAGWSEQVDLAAAFSKFPNGCITVYDTEKNEFYRFNESRCEEQFIPASTFKILNSMIGLETGVITGPDHVMKWDGVERWLDRWNKDHDLESAVQNSVVWYFERLAAGVGPERMAALVEHCNYGNGLTTGGQPFWLRGDIAISANEQVDFLRRLHSRELPLKPESMDTVVDILFIEENKGSKLYGKSGWAAVDGLNIGWFVGWFEMGEGTVFFAANIESESSEGFAVARKSIALECLQFLGYWE